ncbi:hypothetical protein HPB50_002065 [Hyalomma asiaticum]|uniref:Uncharacterized protein n=1 Tax=Hyalomma asiaticum TaxID=266040 RepID=A0ACB7T5H9_HYAAI|nr:hypothetical protein HPB50_002065 [Hyalomma asiaticum]
MVEDTLTATFVAIGVLLLVLLIVVLMRRCRSSERANILRRRWVGLAKRFVMRFSMHFTTPLTSLDVKLQVGQTEGVADANGAAVAKPASKKDQEEGPVTLPPTQELLDDEGPIELELATDKPDEEANASRKSSPSPVSVDVSSESTSQSSRHRPRRHKHRRHDNSLTTQDRTNSTMRSKSKHRHHKVRTSQTERSPNLLAETSVQCPSPEASDSPCKDGDSPKAVTHRQEVVAESVPCDPADEEARRATPNALPITVQMKDDPVLAQLYAMLARRISCTSQCSSGLQRRGPNKPQLLPELDIYSKEPSATDLPSRGSTVEGKLCGINEKSPTIAKLQSGTETSATAPEPLAVPTTPPQNSLVESVAARTGDASTTGPASQGKSRDSSDLNVQEVRAMFVRRASHASQPAYEPQHHGSHPGSDLPALRVTEVAPSAVDTIARGQHGEEVEATRDNQVIEVAKPPTGSVLPETATPASAGRATPPKAVPAPDAVKGVVPSAPDQSSEGRNRNSDDLDLEELRAMFVRRASRASQCSIRSLCRSSDKQRLPSPASKMSVFGDALAMVLVVVGAALTGVLIWLLIRKYDREHGVLDSASQVTKADFGLSPQSPSSGRQNKATSPVGGPLASPQSKDNVPPVASPLGKEPSPDGDAAPTGGPLATSPPAKEALQVTSPSTSLSVEQVCPLSPPGEDHGVEKSTLEGKQVQEKAKRSGATGKQQTKSSPESPQLTKERSRPDQHGKRKAKKHGTASPNATDITPVHIRYIGPPLCDAGTSKRKSRLKASTKSTTAPLPTLVTPVEVAAAPAQADGETTAPWDAKGSCQVRHGDDANQPAIRELRDAFARGTSRGSDCASPLPRHEADKAAAPPEPDIISVEHTTIDAAGSGAPPVPKSERKGNDRADVSQVLVDDAISSTAKTCGGNAAAVSSANGSPTQPNVGGSPAEGLPAQGRKADDPNGRGPFRRKSKTHSPEKPEVPTESDVSPAEPSTLDKPEKPASGKKSKARQKRDL